MKAILSFVFTCPGILILGMISFVTTATAGSLQTGFTTVTVHDLPIGHWTKVDLPGGVPYTVKNTSDQTVTVTLKTRQPFEAGAVGRGFSVIPDPSWIDVTPKVLKIPPRSSATARVTLTIPDDARHIGKRYEGWLVAKGAGPQFQVGLISRIRFNPVAKPVVPSRP